VRRWALRIVVSLFLGVVTTSVVAFAIWRVDRPHSLYSGMVGSTTEATTISQHTNAPATERPHKPVAPPSRLLQRVRALASDVDPERFYTDICQARILTGRASDLIALSFIQRTGDLPAHFDVLFYECGWPFRCLRRHDTLSHSGDRFPFDSLSLRLAPDLWIVPRPVSDSDRLMYQPNRVEWVGLLLNACMLGFPWLIVLIGFASAKRAIRRKRGRCPRCGYDLRGDPGLAAGCSECGWNREESRA
jgi:hypothetical protein